MYGELLGPLRWICALCASIVWLAHLHPAAAHC